MSSLNKVPIRRISAFDGDLFRKLEGNFDPGCSFGELGPRLFNIFLSGFDTAEALPGVERTPLQMCDFEKVVQ